MKQETRELIKVLESYKESVKSQFDYANHWIRRFFRCYLDGGYDLPVNKGYLSGYDLYKANCNILKSIKDNNRKLRSFVISSFMSFLVVEFPLSRSTIQKTIVRTFSTEELETLNKELIEDSLDLIEGVE